MAKLPGAGPAPELPDTERIVERAIESVLEAAPEPRAPSGPDEVKAQPWAETAAPPGKNKRALEDLLREYAERVAAAPGALASAPSERHPAQAFFDRLSRRESGGGRQGRGRRWRQKPRRSQSPAAPRAPAAPPAAKASDGKGASRRRRNRRRRR